VIEAKIGQSCNGLCGLQRKDLWIYVFLIIKIALKPAVIERAWSSKVLSLTEYFMGKPHSWLVVGCGQNPEYDAQVGVFDLRYDPTNYLDLSVGQPIEVMNSRAKAIRCIKANAQPILFSRAFAGSDDLGVDNSEIERRAGLITNNSESVRGGNQQSLPADGAFHLGRTANPRRLSAAVRRIPYAQRAGILEQIEDPRIRESASFHCLSNDWQPISFSSYD
jgi:hypothetical protein